MLPECGVCKDAATFCLHVLCDLGIHGVSILCCFVRTCFAHAELQDSVVFVRMCFGHLREFKILLFFSHVLRALAEFQAQWIKMRVPALSPLVSLTQRMHDRCSDQDQANCADESVITPTAFHSLDAHR